MSDNKSHICTIPKNSTKLTKIASNIPIPEIPSISRLPKIRLIFGRFSGPIASKSPRFLEIRCVAEAAAARRTFHPTQNRKKNVLSKDETPRWKDSFRPRSFHDPKIMPFLAIHPMPFPQSGNRRNRETETKKAEKMESRNCVPRAENRPNNRISQNRPEFRQFEQRNAPRSNSTNQSLLLQKSRLFSSSYRIL